MSIIIYYNEENHTRERIIKWIKDVNDILDLTKSDFFKSIELKIVPVNDSEFMMGYRCDNSFFPNEFKDTESEKFVKMSTKNKVVYY